MGHFWEPGGYNEHYNQGVFTNGEDNFWDQRDNKKPGKASFSEWDYNYQSADYSS
jgi:hypothetical protein